MPWLSTALVQGDITEVRKKSDALGLPPREAWNMECVQQDTLNPKPCSEADKVKYAVPDAGSDDEVDDELLKQMMGP